MYMRSTGKPAKLARTLLPVCHGYTYTRETPMYTCYLSFSRASYLMSQRLHDSLTGVRPTCVLPLRALSISLALVLYSSCCFLVLFGFFFSSVLRGITFFLFFSAFIYYVIAHFGAWFFLKISDVEEVRVCYWHSFELVVFCCLEIVSVWNDALWQWLDFSSEISFDNGTVLKYVGNITIGLKKLAHFPRCRKKFKMYQLYAFIVTLVENHRTKGCLWRI